MKRIRLFLILCACVLANALAPSVRAQEFEGISDLNTTGTAYHVFARPGEATMQILVLGSVGASGVYQVGVGTELDQLLALTGGAPMETTTGSETTVTVRLFREGAGRRDLIYEAQYERMLAEPGLYPPLEDGDVLTVETVTIVRERFGWRDALSIVTSLSTIIILIERLSTLRQ